MSNTRKISLIIRNSYLDLVNPILPYSHQSSGAFAYIFYENLHFDLIIIPLFIYFSVIQ